MRLAQCPTVQFKTEGGHTGEVYVPQLLLNTDAPSVEVEGQSAQEYISNISYSAAQSTLPRLSLLLCCTRERRSATRVWVSDHRVASKAMRYSDTTSSIIQ